MSVNLQTTVAALFHERVTADGTKPALQVKRAGSFEPISWKELSDDVLRTAAGLAAVGVRPGDRVAQFSENRYEWIVSDLAIQIAQAVHVPLHAPLTGQQAAYQINDCDARVVLLSTDEQVEKLAAASDQLAADSHFFAYDDCGNKVGSQVVRSFEELTNLADVKTGEQLKQQALANLNPDSLATILYTSGTTGEPKGVMLSQGNLTSNALAALEIFQQRSDDVRLSFLPHSHIFARTCDVYTWIAAGAQLVLAESRETVIADCQAVQPTLINGVPYFFDKVRRALVDLDREDAKSLHDLLGGRVRMCCSGGAALADHVFDFFNDRDITLAQGYGLTESSPVITAASQVDNRRGSVGRAIPGVEVCIADDGEVLTRGPHVMMGYYNNKAATDEVLRDGWLHTGDLGELDGDGFLRITGRKKEIIVTAAGKNIAPVYLESLLVEDPLILQSLIVGDGRNYLTAVIVADSEQLRSEIIDRKTPLTASQATLAHPEVLNLYEQRIKECLANVSHHEQVRKFTLTDREFTIESGELTPKMSLRRKVVEKNFADEIEEMYGNK